MQFSDLETLEKDKCIARYTKRTIFSLFVKKNRQNDFVGLETLCANAIEMPSPIELGSPLVASNDKLVGIALPQIRIELVNGRALPQRFTRVSVFANWIKAVTRETLWPY